MFRKTRCGSIRSRVVFEILFMVTLSELPTWLTEASVKVCVSGVMSCHGTLVNNIALHTFTPHNAGQVRLLTVARLGRWSCLLWFLGNLLVVS